MKIYIASSWRNKHGVQMLTTILREKGHEVISWIENCNQEGNKQFIFEEWINTTEANDCFNFDIIGATTSDLVIYYGPAGKDACVEVGAAWGSGIPIIGIYAKGEDLGLMRKCMSFWVDNVYRLLELIDLYMTDGTTLHSQK